MKIHSILIMCIVLFIFHSCSKEKKGDVTLPKTIERQLQNLSEIRTTAEKNNDLQNFLAIYSENALSMPEYQQTLTGIDEIEAYYEEIFQRQNIKIFQREVDEFIHLDSTIVEIGTFKKEYTGSNADTLLTQNGKYWNIWDVQPDGNFKLKGEAFGFFHHVQDPEALTVSLQNVPGDKPKRYLNRGNSFELKAYNALMEKGVRTRDGNLRSEFFTTDAKFMPFAEPTVSGINNIKPYLIEYSSRGEVVIDSIACYTYHSENFKNYLLEYAMFKVKWIVPGYVGRTEGKSIRIWKRQGDKSLKLYREIGVHDHLN